MCYCIKIMYHYITYIFQWVRHLHPICARSESEYAGVRVTDSTATLKSHIFTASTGQNNTKAQQSRQVHGAFLSIAS